MGAGMKILKKLMGQTDKPAPAQVQFLCAGAQKAGTTWLSAMLAKHPQVQMLPAKEIHYFDAMHLGVNYPQMRNKLLHNTRDLAQRASAKGEPHWAAHYEAIAAASVKDDAWYKSLFSVREPKFAAGDYSPEYLCLGLAGVQHVKQIMPDARIIILIREPLARAISSLNMEMARKSDSDPALAVASWLFQERGNYAGHVPIWDLVFGDQVLYLPFQRIKSDPKALIAQVEAHLGLKGFDAFENLSRVYNSHSGQYEVSPAVTRVIKRATARQDDYLLERFGPAFCSEI
jgi:hypothetical protein